MQHLIRWSGFLAVLVGGQALTGTFSDYQGWGLDAGYRFVVDTSTAAKPFVSVSLDLKYNGVLSDRSGIGAIGFERINNTGNRWTLPLMGGVYVKF